MAVIARFELKQGTTGEEKPWSIGFHSPSTGHAGVLFSPRKVVFKEAFVENGLEGHVFGLVVHLSQEREAL